FVPEIIEKRKPLADTARRSGWVGCNVLIGKIPNQGRIPIISDGFPRDKSAVVADTTKLLGLKVEKLSSRGWLFDVLNCVNEIESEDFTLDDAYRYVDVLAAKHPDNHNVEAKIRQQLQLLRNKGYIEFVGRGKYKKI
ncbi:MAG: restriction endonuclease, partial [Abditibacteriota bacterium]|nr:restriction endonuclease [Abditibacteriota bacterium]